MHQKLILAVLLCAGAIATTAYGKGSLGAAIPADVAKDGVAVAPQANYATRELADEAAINKCKSFRGGVSESILETCKVVAHFDGQCVAIAYDPAAGTPGFGWGVGADIPAAEEKALAACRDSSKPDRKGSCRVEDRLCDVTG